MASLRILLTLWCALVSIACSKPVRRYSSPDRDPFYDVPSDIGRYAPGTILRNRTITASNLGPDAAKVYQFFYRTNGKDSPDGTVTTVAVPKKPAQGPPRLVAVVLPEDSADIDCAPSYAKSSPTKSNNTAEFTPDIISLAALHQGWYVTIPDLEGSNSAFLAGCVEGPAVLDGIRAALSRHDVIPHHKNVRIAMNGYSGGSHGSGWASHFAPSYAPELNIVGWVAGGLPADLARTFAYNDGTVTSGLNFLGLAGLSAVYPKLDRYIRSHAKSNATAVLDRITGEAGKSGAFCVSQSAALANLTLADSFNVKNISDGAIVQQTWHDEYLGRYYAPVTNFPIWLVHSVEDNVVPYPQAKEYVQNQCTQGAEITFVSLPTGAHGAVQVLSSASQVERLQSFLGHSNGYNDDRECRYETSLPVSLNDTSAKDLLGDYGLTLIQQAIAAAT